MRVVEIITDTNIGGAGVLLINRMKNTDLNKYRTTVLVPRGSRLAERFADIGVRCREVDCRGDRSFDWLAVIEYINVFRQLKPDVINSHGCLSARIAAKFLRVPVKICTRHCFFPISKKLSVRSLRAAVNSELTDRFIAVAYAAKENLVELGVPPEKISVIINGAEALRRLDKDENNKLKSQLGIRADAYVLGICARLEKCKGHEWFFEAVKILLNDGENVVALVIGDGSRRDSLETLSEQYGIDGSVVFVGFAEDVSPYMNIVDININCSVGTETSSLALSEGMSLGKPCVVSDYGGNPYMVRHGENGLVCPCYDSRKMAAYIKELMHDKELYDRMSAAALARFEGELNAAVMTQKTNLLYDRMYESCRKAD